MLDVEAVRIRCNGRYCFEDAAGSITCVDREAHISTDYDVPPDDIQPLTDWWLRGWGGGCGMQPDSTSVCWPDTCSFPEYVAGYSARHISFTELCV